METKTHLTEVEAERLADLRIKARLAHDPAYRYAENAHEQAAAEEAVEETVWAEIERESEIGGAA
jgi:translation initiation factor 2 alpha subunit (eIF-2alpha)